MTEELLRVEHLKKYFPKKVNGKTVISRIVDDVSFTIRAGETLGLVGESGCGKSTVGRTILHLHTPTGGKVFFKGEEVTARNIQRLRPSMQMVFQDPYSSLDPRMTVEDIIGEPLDVHHLYKSRADRREQILELMSYVGLNPDFSGRYPHEFSGGQRQRVGIARALAVHPDFIIADEPVSALDVSIQAQVVNMFEDLQKKLGVAYLFISHDLLVVRHISSRVAIMYLGHIMEIGNVDEVYDHPIHPYTQCLLSALPLPDPDAARARKRIELTGDVPSPLHAPSGCPFRTRCPYADEQCATACPGLTERGNDHAAACWKF